MAIYKDEIFGGAQDGASTLASYGEAIALVNSNMYANGVAIFTSDVRGAPDYGEVEVGMVGVAAADPEYR